jgi:hypothetical protein
MESDEGTFSFTDGDEAEFLQGRLALTDKKNE